MSAEHPPFRPEVANLLQACQGWGAVVAAVPAGEPPVHHFYAGVTRAPAVSFLEALLLALGGDLPENGGRRYEEIVVISASRKWNENNLDKPPEEILRLSLPGGATAERGGDWSTWWYRKPPMAEGREASRPADGGRPDPLGKGRGARAERWADFGQKPSNSTTASEFPLRITCTEQGRKFPDRHRELMQIIETLQERPHRTLLLLEVSVLDYATPESAPADHHEISEEGIRHMARFPAWIDAQSERKGRLDVVIYSRNRNRVDAFLGAGLPRKPDRYQGEWPFCAYHGRNLIRVEYPCGSYPWGERLFVNDRGFEPRDGTPGDSPQGRRSYPNRNLRGLLRGETPSGQVARLRFAAARPLPPPRPEPHDLIDREFWSRIELPVLRSALDREYFGARENAALTELLDTMTFMQDRGRNILDPQDFHAAVEKRWLKASTIFLWGEGGTGKSHLGMVLGDLVYGHSPLTVLCQEAGGGGGGDPATNFRAYFFGAPAGYQDSDHLTSVGLHLVTTQGFTVVVLDEANKIAHGDFGSSMQVLYGIVHDRKYTPMNPILTQNRPISLWNTVFVLTANLPKFPPPDVKPEDRKAITRRFSDYEMKVLDEEGAVRFSQWFLPRAIEKTLGGVAICTCDDLTGELARLRLQGRSPDTIQKELGNVIDRASESLEEAGITPVRCPSLLDVTEYLREALS
ncbi:MAG TPA: hypothetical protein VMW27_15045 [Thermoanaerobaculia bacterium]|nr:hypothetical protein [Thermoanaerobaculia bacterium]